MKRGQAPWGEVARTRWSHWSHSFFLDMEGQVVLRTLRGPVDRELVDLGMRKSLLGRWVVVLDSHLAVPGEGSHMAEAVRTHLAGAVHNQLAEADQGNQLAGAVQDNQLSGAAVGDHQED